MFAALPERRFCVPAPESHRNVAVLVSSLSHIPFGRLFSCQGSQSPHLLWTKGCQNTTLLPKKVFSFFYRPGMFLSLLLLVQKNHFGLKNLKTSLNFLLVGKFSECTKLFSNFTNHLHLHTSTFLMATFLRLCTKLFRSFYKTFTTNPHFLIGTKNDKTATRSFYFSIGTKNSRNGETFLRKMGRKHGENSTVLVNAKLPKTLIFQGFSTLEVPNSTGDSGSERLPCI